MLGALSWPFKNASIHDTKEMLTKWSRNEVYNNQKLSRLVVEILLFYVGNSDGTRNPNLGMEGERMGGGVILFSRRQWYYPGKIQLAENII
jgi:hypothetical protein